jgi:hypothetical protein
MLAIDTAGPLEGSQAGKLVPDQIIHRAVARRGTFPRILPQFERQVERLGCPSKIKETEMPIVAGVPGCGLIPRLWIGRVNSERVGPGPGYRAARASSR